MINLVDVSLRYGEKVIYNKISTTIGVRDRMGLVGSNGSGKSTLIKLLLGEAEIDSGEVERPNYVTLGYLPQDGIEVKGKSLYDEVSNAFEDVLELQKNIDEADEKMLEMDTNSEEYYDLLDQIGAWEQKLEALSQPR